MNNPQVRKYSETFAKHLGSQSSGFGEQIESAYQRPSGARRPNRNEAARAFLTSSGSQPPKERLADFCQTLFSLNEFVYQQ